jgi:hypothetical protein
MIDRHISKEHFIHVYDNKFFTPLYSDRSWVDKPGIAYHLYDGGFLEANNNWYAGIKCHNYFKCYNDLLIFIFENPIIPQWLLFSPGACYIVTKEQVLKYPKEFYENLKFLVSYTYFPSEAYHVERMLGLIFSGNYKLQQYMMNSIVFQDELKKYRISTMLRLKQRSIINSFFSRIKEGLKFRYNLLLYKLIIKNNS